MKIVIDSNRIIAALIKEGTTREIIFTETIDFIAPDFIKIETSKYKDEIMKKVNITSEEFDILLSLIFEHIEIIPKADYEKHLHKMEKEISDTKDIPYLATALATQADGIWSHDSHFIQQKKVKIFSNIDILKIIRK
mgnify:CR=1 FL=1